MLWIALASGFSQCISANRNFAKVNPRKNATSVERDPSRLYSAHIISQREYFRFCLQPDVSKTKAHV